MKQEERLLYVLKLAQRYRPTTETINFPADRLHEKLAKERLPNGKPLYESDISAIVHYFYYQGDPANIGKIMASPRFK